MLPYLAQGANSAVEDGAVLGLLLGHVKSKDQVPQALKMYETLRKARAEAVVKETFKQVSTRGSSDGKMLVQLRREKKTQSRVASDMIFICRTALSRRPGTPCFFLLWAKSSKGRFPVDGLAQRFNNGFMVMMPSRRWMKQSGTSHSRCIRNTCRWRYLVGRRRVTHPNTQRYNEASRIIHGILTYKYCNKVHPTIIVLE